MKLVKAVIPLILAASLLSGCSQVPQDMKNPGGNIKNEENRDMSNIGFSEFDDDLISYIAPTIDGENYMISPLSFRYAMALATAGATGEAKEELLKAMGFSSLEEYTKWTNEINDIVIKFDESLQRDIKAVSSAVDSLRILFEDSNDADVARTIITLMDTKDHLIRFQKIIAEQKASSEPVIDLSDSSRD